MKEAFIQKRLRQDRLDLIDQVNAILENYRAQGYDLTVRQVYYQLVAKDMIPNNLKSYNRIKSVISDGRLIGLIDWDMIVDRGRPVIFPSHWTDPASIVRSAAQGFRIDRWKDQPYHLEVMVEKQALEGVLIPVCDELDVRFSANKGYSSQSAMYRAGKRMEDAWLAGKSVHVLYLGDFDPSGLDMDRDIEERMSMFGQDEVPVSRLALTTGQIDQYGPPENPAKMSDSRAEEYIKIHGYSSWELDALEPRVLADLVRTAVIDLRDEAIWEETMDRENEMKEELETFADNYGK